MLFYKPIFHSLQINIKCKHVEVFILINIVLWQCWYHNLLLHSMVVRWLYWTKLFICLSCIRIILLYEVILVNIYRKTFYLEPTAFPGGFQCVHGLDPNQTKKIKSKPQKLEIFPHVFGWGNPIETIVAVHYFEVLMLACFLLPFPEKDKTKVMKIIWFISLNHKAVDECKTYHI